MATIKHLVESILVRTNLQLEMYYGQRRADVLDKDSHTVKVRFIEGTTSYTLKVNTRLNTVEEGYLDKNGTEIISYKKNEQGIYETRINGQVERVHRGLISQEVVRIILDGNRLQDNTVKNQVEDFKKLLEYMVSKSDLDENIVIKYSETYKTYVGEFSKVTCNIYLVGVEGLIIGLDIGEEEEVEQDGGEIEVVSVGEQKAMTVDKFNKFMQLCKTKPAIRYVTPTIHPHFRIVVAVEVQTSDDTKKFSITDNSNGQNLYERITEYVNNLK